jgi:hypothetical protein
MNPTLLMAYSIPMCRGTVAGPSVFLRTQDAP